jgi:hypothetical protein
MASGIEVSSIRVPSSSELAIERQDRGEDQCQLQDAWWAELCQDAGISTARLLRNVKR